MRDKCAIWLLAPTVLAACASPTRHTLAELHGVEPDTSDVQIESGLDRAMEGYRQYLAEAPESALKPEAMRRLADLKLEKEFGILGDGDSGASGLPAPKIREVAADSVPAAPAKARGAVAAVELEDPAPEKIEPVADFVPHEAGELEWSGPLEAIELYDELLTTYPDYAHNDQVLYQKARAFDELGRNDEAIAVIDRLVAEYPDSRYVDEVQFRRAEYFFVRRKYYDAEQAYAAITIKGPVSEYYELALYKLGWSLYKQEMHEEALDQYVALLDYKVSTGYDFDAPSDESSERRVADTYRVISLSFSSIGGPEAVQAYFETKGTRGYEDRIYSHLGEFYFEKLRYQDAAAAYQMFVSLHPLHRSAPQFGMRIVEIYEAGGFPILVLETKKDFAGRYALNAEYWRHFDVNEMPDVLAYLKSNLEDLANHYHALYQEPEAKEEQAENFAEALQWYRAFLESFPQDEKSPSVNHQLADLLLEHEDFGAAALEYERTAYEYPPHEQAAEAGYAAIYAHREHEKSVGSSAEGDTIRRAAVESTLRFAETFPEHEHASVVLGAAVDDLYDMREFERAIAVGEGLLARYPDADQAVRREAWAAVANSYFDLERFEPAENAYSQLLGLLPEDDDSREAVIDNLAAAIYKQGEEASAVGDQRAAADHFLRVAQSAPTSKLRAAADYDAGAALVRLEAWGEAAQVFEDFRENHPDHELNREATKQIASVRRSQGDLAKAAAEYERVADESDDDPLRREAMLLAGELHEESGGADRALAVYRAYVDQYPTPVETAVETRNQIAEILRSAGREDEHRAELRSIVEADRNAGAERTDRTRYLAARAALVLAEDDFRRFVDVELTQPFERNLRDKQQRMKTALASFSSLVDYEVGDVTAAATYYMAEVYSNFSRSLMESERPHDLESNELIDYELALEEMAFPFEEKAIEVHEKNLELMSTGLYNDWIEKSLGQLATLMPGRYAKFEASSGLIASLDQYAYRAPRAPAKEPAPSPAASEPAESVEPDAATENTIDPAKTVAPEPPSDGTPGDAIEGPGEGTIDGVSDDAIDATMDDPMDGPIDATTDDAIDGTMDDTIDGTIEDEAPIEEAAPQPAEVI